MAGPLGFSEVGRAFLYNKLIPTIKGLGYDVLDPWSLTDRDEIARVEAMPYGLEKRKAAEQLNALVASNNRNAIDIACGLVAVLDGADVDSGTAAEIGYAFARGLPVLGYRNDLRLSGEEGSIVNPQVEYFVRANGGAIVRHLAELPESLSRVFGGLRSTIANE